MLKNCELFSEHDVYIFEFSFYIDSIKVSIQDEDCLNCNYFSFLINIEPSFTSSSDNFQEIKAHDLEAISDLDSEVDDDSRTQFLTDWYRINEHPLKTFDIFFSDINGKIKECVVAQKVNCSGKLPNWIVKMAKQFHYFSNNCRKFELFLLSILQIRVTIWASKYESINSAEIWEIGEVVIKISENQSFSKNSFFFVHKIPDYDAIFIKEDANLTTEFTIGVLKGFFSTIPSVYKSCDKEFNKEFPKDKDHFEENQLPNKSVFLNESSEIYIHDYVPLKWEYLDDDNNIRGPFNSIVMMSWIIKGYFSHNSKLRLFSQIEDINYNKDHKYLISNFNPLSQCILIIKSDVLRMFPNAVDSNWKQTSLSNLRYTQETNSREVRDSTNFFENNHQATNRPKIKNIENELAEDQNFLYREQIEEIFDSLKNRFSKIEIEFNKKISGKLAKSKKSGSKNQVDNRNYLRKEISNRDQVIEYATKNVFRQERNVQFKKWCAEYGPELVLEACAIRIQTAYRKYIRRKRI